MLFIGGLVGYIFVSRFMEGKQFVCGILNENVLILCDHCGSKTI